MSLVMSLYVPCGSSSSAVRRRHEVMEITSLNRTDLLKKMSSTDPQANPRSGACCERRCMLERRWQDEISRSASF